MTQSIGNKILAVVLSLVMILSLTITTRIDFADTSGEHGGTIITGWTTPENAGISDNVYARSMVNASMQSSGAFKVKGFNFAIPDSATITGIEVAMERKQVKNGGSGLYDELATLIIDDAIIYGSNQAVLYSYWPTVESIKIFGSPTSLWGQALTPAIVNSPNFGFYFTGRKTTFTVTASIDYIGMTVYYSLPISDTTAPVIDPHADMIVEATSSSGTIVEFTATAIDDIDPAVAVLATPASGSQFALGITPVSLDAADSTGNIAVPVIFNVTVQDSTAPVITLLGSNPVNIVKDAPYSEEGATWTDAVDGSGFANVGGDIVDTSVSGSYLVTYDFTDAAGNVALQVSRTVVVLDAIAPVIDPQSDLIVEATSSSGAIVTFSPSATDNLDPSVTVISTPASGSQFALGVTPVTLDATDSAGNTAIPVIFNVTVQDTIAPVITLLGNNPVNINQNIPYIEEGASWADAVDGSGFAVVGGDIVNTSLAGSYIVTYDFTDAAGNVAPSVTRTVNVLDATGPVIDPQSDMIVEATSSSGAIVTFSPTASDNVDPSVTVISTPASGSQFALGLTPVTLDAADSAGNTAAPVIFNVTVVDTTKPVITLLGANPININQNVPYIEEGASWADAVDGSGFAVVGGDVVNTSVAGSYIVTYDFTDAAGNVATSVTRTVNVLDNTAPIIDPQSDMIIEASSASGAMVTFSPTATDNLDPSVVVISTPASGSLFPLGVTPVTLNATDAAGNAALPVTFNVTVVDTTIPVITLTGTNPVNIYKNTPYLEEGATWTDAVDGAGVAIVSGDSVLTRVVGSYIITYNYTDAAGNAALSVTRTVNVLDTTRPVIAKHSTLYVEATSASGAIATFTTKATDNLDPSVTVVATPASGSQFPLGTTLVTLNATDSAGNTAIPVTFNVIVRDKTRPVITLVDSTPYYVDYAGTYVEPGATWTDAVDGSGVALVSGKQVDTMRPGNYQIKYNYTDAAGNKAVQVTRTVIVRTGGTINVSKVVRDLNGNIIANSQRFIILMNGANGMNVTQTRSINFSRLVPGTYTITEVPNSKYTLTDIIGDNDNDPTNGVTITIGSGETQRITFVNQKK